jgi:hypothetical protein
VTPPPVVFTTPVATADFYTTPNRTALTVPAPGVLVNDAPGVGPAALTAQLLSGPDPRSGTLSLNPDGSFVFVPAANFNGNAVFVYQANNGAFLSAPVAVTVTVAPPVITPGGTGLKTVYATGAAAGGGPQVNEYDGASGALIRSFFAYDPAFLGGVRVATGDVNGDGVPDIVTAAGPGGGPHVKVFDGRTGALLLQFFAYDSGFTGGVFVAIGDVNGDGQADIITGAGAGGGPHVKAFDGATGAQVASFFAYTASFTGGVTVASGDVNGDGVADIITGAGAGGGPHVKAFSGGAFNEIASFFAYNPGFTGGVFVTAGDVMGFGRSQIITGPGFGGGPDVKGFDVPTGQTVFDIFAYNPGDTASSLISSDPTFQYSNGVTVTTTSLGNDKRADLVVAPAQGLGSLVRVIDGASLNSVRDFFAYDPSFLGGAYVG